MQIVQHKFEILHPITKSYNTQINKLSVESELKFWDMISINDAMGTTHCTDPDMKCTKNRSQIAKS